VLPVRTALARHAILIFAESFKRLQLLATAVTIATSADIL
jgi:hypothetical protein